ncbi:MAG: hypothetical protein V1913_06635 [Fibrobacterota bacterium]
MRIAILIPPESARYGGARDHARVLADALTALGADVRRVPGPFSTLRAVSIAARIAREGCTAAVLPYTPNLFGWRSLFPVLLLWAFRRRGIRSITYLHEIFMPSYCGFLRNAVQRPWNAAKDRLVFALSDRPVVSFHRRADELERATGRRPDVVPVFSNLPEADPGGRRAAATHLLGYFGTLHPDIDTCTLAAALRRLPGARMLLIGDLTRPPELREQCDGTGPLLPAEAAVALTRIKYFVLCDARGISFRKGSAAAALLNRVPVIATRSEWTDCEFRHKENVWFFNGGETDLCRAVAALEADPALAARIAGGGRALYDAHMAPDIAARRILAMAEA